MHQPLRPLLAASVFAVLGMSGAAQAQRAGEDAVTNASDAFGSAVGLESTGIYTEFDTRGFSPGKAGNIRFDGIYADPIGLLPHRLRASTTIRVGFSAEDYPFHAPTGIVDHKFRSFPDELGLSLTFNGMGHNGFIAELDFRIPVIKDHVSLTGGSASARLRQTDGSGTHTYSLALRPIFRFAGAEISPYISRSGFHHTRSRPLAVVTGDFLPKLPEPNRYLGQSWAEGSANSGNLGLTVKAALSSKLSLRAGILHAIGPRLAGYTEIFSLVGASGMARHRLIADPRQDIHATSGEAQVALRLVHGRWQHRFIAGFRARNRYTETGGSVVRNYEDLVAYGAIDPQPEENFAFGPVNAGRVTQSSLMLGYTGKLVGLGSINLGLQKARFRGTSRDGRTGIVTTQRDDPWLYNATIGIDLANRLSIYLGTERGLEDSGTVPENAINRNEQLPATRSTQYEGGVRWKFPGGQLVVNAFQIEKPYFSFDANDVFTQLGNVRHRGIETSLTGHFGKRLNLVAGAVLMQPRVTGGLRPAGTPSFYARIDANYRTDIFGGLTPTISFAHTGARAVGAQLTVPGYSTLDLGLRHKFKIGKVPASARLAVNNVFDAATWKVVAANTLYPEERRKLTFSLSADL